MPGGARTRRALSGDIWTLDSLSGEIQTLQVFSGDIRTLGVLRMAKCRRDLSHVQNPPDNAYGVRNQLENPRLIQNPPDRRAGGYRTHCMRTI